MTEIPRSKMLDVPGEKMIKVCRKDGVMGQTEYDFPVDKICALIEVVSENPEKAGVFLVTDQAAKLGTPLSFEEAHKHLIDCGVIMLNAIQVGRKTSDKHALNLALLRLVEERNILPATAPSKFMAAMFSPNIPHNPSKKMPMFFLTFGEQERVVDVSYYEILKREIRVQEVSGADVAEELRIIRAGEEGYIPDPTETPSGGPG